jgi:hypothetical protein
MSYEDVPPEIEYLLLIVCGNEWPDGDIGQLRSDADAWRSVSESLSGVQQEASSYARLAEEGWSGAAGEAFSTYWNSLTGGSQSFIPLLAQVCGELADSLDEAADQIETVRIDIVASVMILAAELAWDAAMAFCTAGATEELAVEQILETRVAVLNYIRQAAMELAYHEVKQAAIQFVVDLIAQGIEKIQHSDIPINWEEAGYAAVNGAVGGAVGFGAGLLLKGLGKGIFELDKLAGEPGAQALDHLSGMPIFKAQPKSALTGGGTAHPGSEGNIGGDASADAGAAPRPRPGGEPSAGTASGASGPRPAGNAGSDAAGHAGGSAGGEVSVTADGDPRTAPNTESGADPAPREPYTWGKVAAYPAKLLGDMALNVAVGPAEAAAQDAALNNGQVSQSDPIAGALNGIGNGGFGRIRKVNPGDEPLDMAVKGSQELLGKWPLGIKNALWPGAVQPSGTSDHSGPPSESSTQAPPHAPSPTPSTHSGGSDNEGVGTWYSSGPSSPASSIHSASTQDTGPATLTTAAAPTRTTTAPAPAGIQPAVTQPLAPTSESADTSPLAPSSTGTIHWPGSGYVTVPLSPVLSHAKGLAGLDGESGALVPGTFAADHPVQPAPVPTSDVPAATPDTPLSAVQPPVVSPDQGDTPLLSVVQSPPGLPGLQLASGLPPSLSAASTPGSITDGDVDLMETSRARSSQPGSHPSIGRGRGGRPEGMERDGDDDSSEGLPGL